MNRVGIIGGTFNPPHNGHLLIASEVLTELNLAEVWFMPNNIPPHKEQKIRISNSDRMNLLSLAIAGQPKFKVQPIELEREGPSYTIDTMRIVTDKYKDTKFYFIIGADMVEYLPHWYKIEELLELVTFVGVKRPGYSFSSQFPIVEVNVPQFDISSSMIRKRLKEKANTMYLLPEKVRQYIEENHLYGS
ncbi:nicotinate-nucleotide adenylyltransferase [Fredinandcohnia quinoae]|uniref:Probable nicotinate-nucleotide adenylyltransferase n=1 Tax=Fredinandcohnia quinoae TaxID=2918902 RepID=A0AAW5E2J8_9BACI|nr:nicotinate-nucleotide adenylyltransferase [Fredinandcohnia sp. SECRCQ15]MCH1625009.1 nicotinate-nucleotide adenylyltransferase [Fredinandcohnia sp. SECRCQ15]